MEELLHCYVACSKQSILHPSTLWKSYFTVTWHVQSNLYFIHPLYGRVTSLLRGMFKAIYTSSIHSMEELLHCYVACSKQSILHPSTLWKSYFTVTWHVQSNLYFIHPLYGRVTSLLRGMFKAIYTSSIHSMEESLLPSVLHGTFKAVTYGPQQLYVLLSQLAVNILHLLKLLLVSFGVLWNPKSSIYMTASTAILDRDTQQQRLQKLLRCGCQTLICPSPSAHWQWLQWSGTPCRITAMGHGKVTEHEEILQPAGWSITTTNNDSNVFFLGLPFLHWSA